MINNPSENFVVRINRVIGLLSPICFGSPPGLRNVINVPLVKLFGSELDESRKEKSSCRILDRM